MAQITSYRLALIGFGAVGRGLASILRDHHQRLAERDGVAFSIVAVTTRSSGTRYDPSGLDLDQLLADDPALDASRVAWSAEELIAQGAFDVLVEVSPTDLQTAEPATSRIRAAIQRGLHVVTANKGPLALYGQDLLQLSQDKGISFGYEATVMAGTPALRLGWSDLAGNAIQEIKGIVNGTTNYILTQMDAGQPYAEALAAAQALGYAETDPTGDVEGFDAAGKAVILANMLLGATLRPEDVDREGITQISVADVAAAQAAGERWKLIARVARGDGQITASVRPMRLPLSHPLAGVSGATNALTYTTDLLGDVTIIGPGAGGIATGFGLLSDLLSLPRA